MSTTSSCVSCFVKSTLLVFALVENAKGYPMGPPLSTCLTRFPLHGPSKQMSLSPFKIKLSSPTYTIGQNITVILEADDGTPFKGVMISAHRKSQNTEEFQGRFLSFTPADKLGFVNCHGGRHNQVTHKNPTPVTKVEVVWQAPDINAGDLVFSATFVQEFTTFWQTEKDISSLAPGPVVQPEIVLEASSPVMDDIDFSSCGDTKGCLFYPRLCQGADCDVALTYTSQGDLFTFEMMAATESYVSFGISHDNQMGDDHTMSCTAQGTRLSVQNGFNHPEYYNERLFSYNLTNKFVKKANGKLMCRFSRPRVYNLLQVTPYTDPPQTKVMPFDLNEPWFLFLCWGFTGNDTDVMVKHKDHPILTAYKIDLRSHDLHRGSIFNREMQAHAVLMVLAWMVAAGLATVIARHYKDMCFHKRWFGTKVWFQVHRAIAASVLVFTAISFIIVFVKMKKISVENFLYPMNHAIIGITVGVAVCLQILGGLLRPGFDSKARPFFNWGHRLLGQGAHILAAVNFYFAFNLYYTPKAMQRFGTIVVLVWIGVQVLWELVFEIWSCRKKAAAEKQYTTNAKGMTIEDSQKDAPATARTDSILLMLYTLTLAAFAAAACCAIFLF